jgi:molybdopterin synthase catalytic subunit
MANPNQQFEGEQSLSEPNIYVSLTYDPLNASAAMARVKSPKAGAVVLFAGMPSVPLKSVPSDYTVPH